MSNPDEWSFEWTRYLVTARDAFEFKHGLEKRTATLLERDTAAGDVLVYRGDNAVAPNRYRLELTLRGAAEGKLLFRLHLLATAPRQWVNPEKLQQDATRAFDYWLREMEWTADEPAWRGSPEAYRRAMAIAVDREAEDRRRREDRTGVAEIQQEILSGLRNGRRFSTAHKEGGTNISFQSGVFVRQDFGESEERLTFRAEGEFLEFLRRFYDWEARREIYPHPPLELDAWKYILAQLRI